MADAMIFLVDGFEETEALVTLDILRRGGLDVPAVSLNGSDWVTGAHHITIKADARFENAKAEDSGVIIMPGGPGTPDYENHADFISLLKTAAAQNKLICAICAAPSVLGRLGLLKGRTAVCYPGFEGELKGAIIGKHTVDKDGNFITSRGPATAADFGFAILAECKGKAKADEVRKGMLFK
ncbi:MAG: DJ-1/PfpI family protein [Defluviitaleaceae bacterium]|nr:DJ-1/PfpI family protein [Defluviitaleaceae bacterium]